MTHNLHEFVPLFTLYLNVQNAQNPSRKHFEKTNTFPGSKEKPQCHSIPVAHFCFTYYQHGNFPNG